MSINRNSVALLIFMIGCLSAFYIGQNGPSAWLEQSRNVETFENANGDLAFRDGSKEVLIGPLVAYEESPLRQESLSTQSSAPTLDSQWVLTPSGDVKRLSASFHFGLWSLLPAFLTIALCLLTREPLTALLSGIIAGSLMLREYDIVDGVLISNLSTTSAAGILVLYLWLLGGLLGIWSKTGAAKAFADYMATHFVKGPRSAKVVAWLLGVLFFQGGTMSTVLVGTTVKPLADKANVSHEEMSYIVDSTSAPIASVLAFNAWPAYVQALIFVPGVTFLATESQRVAFFFQSIPFSFYGILAVIGTLLLSLNITFFSGKRIRDAKKRAETTGQLDAPDARPLSAKELHHCDVPNQYSPHVLEFLLPLGALISTAVLTFVFLGTPKVTWAFTLALVMSFIFALSKGMSLSTVLEGFGNGLKGVVVASVILMLAVTVGSVSKEIGGGLYLVNLLGDQLPFWTLPVILQLLTMVIAFSTGTSWGTYAIAFPLAMPLAWAVAQSQGVSQPEIFMMVCFASVLNGSVYGDQCSPISDTTILSSMTTGCDLMDHVKSQIVPATFAAVAAAILWTGTVLVVS